MYVPPYSASTTGTASTMHEAPQNSIALPTLPQNVYSRTPFENSASSSVQLSANISEEGRKTITDHWSALQKYVDFPYTSDWGTTKMKLMTAYVQSLIYYGAITKSDESYEALNFVSKVRGCGETNRGNAVESAQNAFHHGLTNARSGKDLFHDLKHYAVRPPGSMIGSLRKLHPNDFINTDTIRLIHDAIGRYVKAGGDLALLCFDTNPKAAAAELGKYMADDRARYAAEIMLTKPVGYMSIWTDQGVVELRAPAQQAAAQPTQVVDPQITRPPSNVLKRPLDSGYAADQSNATGLTVVSKHVRDGSQQQSTADTVSNGSLASSRPLLSGRSSSMRSDSSASSSFFYDRDSQHRNDGEDAAQSLDLLLSQDFQEALSSPGFSVDTLQFGDRSTSRPVLDHSSDSFSISTDGLQGRAATAAHQQAPDGETAANPSDIDDLLESFPQDLFPNFSWEDLVVSIQRSNHIAEDSTQRTPSQEHPKSPFSELFEEFDRTEAESNSNPSSRYV